MSPVPAPRSLFDRTIQLIGRSLDVRSLNHKALSGNIANAETPGYRARNVPFQDLLEKSLGGLSQIGLTRTHARHLPAEMEEDSGIESTQESVDIDREMAKLADNNIMFQAGIQSLAKKFEALRFTITDSGLGR
jgi:flagellar basal-body rod protein FlgB